MAADGATARYGVDGVFTEIGTATGVFSEIIFGRSGAGTVFHGTLDLYEAFTSPAAVTLSDMIHAREVMTDEYGSALA